MRNNWSYEESVVAFNLYCKIPFSKTVKGTREVIDLAKMLNRTPSAVAMKLGNFGRFDPALHQEGIRGLEHSSRLDEQVWNEFNGNWDELAYKSELLLKRFKHERGQENNEGDKSNELLLPVGVDVDQNVKARVNQGFFREAVLAAHNMKCCVTGLDLPQLLVASHIKPWKESDPATERTNPRNGLCLNALHDRAFDRGFMTIDTSFKIVFSKEIHDAYSKKVIKMFFADYEGQQIMMPHRFVPERKYIEWHNKSVFKD